MYYGVAAKKAEEHYNEFTFSPPQHLLLQQYNYCSPFSAMSVVINVSYSLETWPSFRYKFWETINLLCDSNCPELMRTH